MARAKRTDRSAARRRHRAQITGELDAAESGGEAATTAADRPVPAQRRPPGRPRPGTRPDPLAPSGPTVAGVGIRRAFGMAFRPLTLREDLALLPRLLRHRAFWIPALLAVVTTGAVISFRGEELISRFAATYFLAPPPIGGIFLAGFLAPRASYLIGALFGVLSSVLLAVSAASLSEVVGADANPTSVLISGLSISPLSGIFFGAAAAWYRRFLQLATPARPAPRGQAQRPAGRGR